MEQFCEYIEDCEFPELSIKILHLLGEEGAKYVLPRLLPARLSLTTPPSSVCSPHSTSAPAKFIRYIFNRVILETASVRAAAVTSLAKFGASVPSLTDSVVVLLQR
jgi:coatomer protein complex subunit gamma